MYLIPRNISQRFEFIPGYGWFEFFVVLTGFIIGAIAFFGLKLFHVSTFPRIIFLLFFTGSGIMAVSPIMPDGSTTLDMLRYMIRFSKSTKLYLYEKGGL